jgi:hypothetical protein
MEDSKMKKYICYLSLAISAVLTCLTVSSCDETIHEYPKPQKALVIIQANVDRNPPAYYKEVLYDESFNRKVIDLDSTKAAPKYTPDEDYRMRLTFEIYRGNISDYSNNSDDLRKNMVDRRVLYVDKDALPPQDTIHTYQENGDYFVLVFADYVLKDATANNHYHTDSLTNVRGDIHNYPANTHHRSTAAGQTEFNINFLLTEEGYPATKEASKQPITSRIIPVYLQRPSGRYRFIATDYDDFIRNGGNPQGITVKVIYKQFVTVGYNSMKRTPNLFISTYSFNNRPFLNASNLNSSIITTAKGHELSLLVDYLFTHYTDEDNIVADVYFYDENGKEINHVSDITIPLLRNHETVIRGYFLTKSFGKDNGIAIDENFDGEYVVYF